MARKNLIGISETSSDDKSIAKNVGRPIAGFAPQERLQSPVGGITKSLGNITQKMERANKLERQLADGQLIVELDPMVIDGSFVIDRLGEDPEALSQLVEQLRENGQQVPILVRPHPERPGRYQVAYGHRRLAAVRRLGGKVKAAVRQLTDDQLVVSQGQENNARTNLSYIERALFAAKLEERGFSRDIIMSSLGVDKAALSKMISLIDMLPVPLIEHIGAAPNVGRRRWMELAERLGAQGSASATEILDNLGAQELTSDQRFQRVFLGLAGLPIRVSTTREWLDEEPPVAIKKALGRSTFVFDSKAAPGFDSFIEERLVGLFAEFRRNKGA